MQRSVFSTQINGTSISEKLENRELCIDNNIKDASYWLKRLKLTCFVN
jgi:hypothetical protein